MLNSKKGVIPHAFLPGQPRMPETVRDISANKLSQLVVNHLTFSREMATPFSSWSPDLGTALHFATGQYSEHTSAGAGGGAIDMSQCFIAVVDTWKMFTKANRPYRIVSAGKMGQTRVGCEYLVYGPVQGPAYTVVRIEDIQQAVGCSQWPCCPTRNPMPHAFTAEELQEAYNMSKLFNGSKAMKLTVFLAENCRQQWASPVPGDFDQKLGSLLPDKRTLSWKHSRINLKNMMVFLSGCKDLVGSRKMLPLFNSQTDAPMMGQLQLACSATAHATLILESGFETFRNQLSEEEAEIRKPYLCPQEHVHNCSAQERQWTEWAEGYELRFLSG